MHSLSRRLLVSVSVPLIAFFGITIAVLDSSFRDLSESSLREQLNAHMIALIAAADLLPGGGVAPLARGLDSRLATPGSGLYAQIRTAGNGESWSSPSTAGVFVDFGPELAPGARRFTYLAIPRGSLAVVSRGIAFEDEGQTARKLTFSVAASLAPYEQQLARFREKLLGWFVSLTLLLLAILGALLRWVLGPVRRLETEINAVEEGERESLGEGYPRELAGVATNLNTLLIGERRRLTRYRDTLGNLAHGLKTPLAVMRSTLESGPAAGNDVLCGQIDRMSAIIGHQLARAASGGALLGQAPLEVASLAGELRVALLRVYARKDLTIELAIAPGVGFIGDRGDFLELCGNLLDNACKWCRSRVRLTAAVDPAAETRQRLAVLIEDDGPGITEGDRARVLERGVRADESVPGHGLGLAMVRETVDLYGGTLAIGASELGGALVRVSLPGR